MIGFKTKLAELLSSEKISESQYSNFLKRGMRFEKFDSKYPQLQGIFPDGIAIGASDPFIENLDFPYQETSYVCASTGNQYPKTYLYKIDKKHGGVVSLTGGKRPIGDNLYASLNRILLGSHAIMISADNLIKNASQIWDWSFFGRHIKSQNPQLYEELERLAENHTKKKIQVILARKKSTFEELDFLKKYSENKIAIFDSDKEIIFLTNNDGYDYSSKTIKPDSRIRYITEAYSNGEIDIKESLKKLRKKFDIKIMLNDGGRQMSDGLVELGLLGGERITYEPFPGDKFMPEKIQKDMILGKDGLGIDGSALKDSIVAYSHELNEEKNELFNLHLYSI